MKKIIILTLFIIISGCQQKEEVNKEDINKNYKRFYYS